MSIKQIFLDTRESDDKFVTIMIDKATESKFDIVIRTLDVGDIQCGNIIIERKSINDFYSSVSGDHLWNQIANMKSNTEYNSIIMLSGRLQELHKLDDIKINVIMGAMKKITSLGIPLIWVQNDNELVVKALEFFAYAESNEDFVPIKRVEKNKKDSLFMALPHVGRKAAKKLIKKFDNMETLVYASEKEIQLVVGPKKGSDIYKALRE